VIGRNAHEKCLCRTRSVILYSGEKKQRLIRGFVIRSVFLNSVSCDKLVFVVSGEGSSFGCAVELVFL